MAVKQNNRQFCFWVMFVLTVLVVVHVSASESIEYNNQDYFDMSIEELMDVEVVVSGSRREHKKHELTAPVSVIYAEDIHYGGHTNIAEMLRFVPGVDVARYDRNNYAVSIRGFQGITSDRVLVLINGTSITNPIFGTVDFSGYPIFAEDIDRIEIVRGTAGAAWGANTINGVINIITKKPDQIVGGFSSTTVDEYGDVYTQLRYAESSGKWSWKTSVGYDDWCSGEDTGIISPAGPDATIDDCGSVFKTSNDVIYNFSEDTKITFNGSYSYEEFGTDEFMGNYSGGDILSSTSSLSFKLDHEFDSGDSVHVKWVGDFLENRNFSYFTNGYKFNQNSVEAQYDFEAGSNHSVSLGANFELLRVFEYEGGRALSDDPAKEKWAGFYIIDSIDLSEQTTIETQARLDHYSEVGWDWSGRFTVLHGLDIDKNHTLRFSMARAFRSPSIYLRLWEDDTSTPGPPPPPGSNLQASLDNETVESIEAGYTGNLSSNTTLGVNAYFMQYRNILGGKMSGGQIEYSNLCGGSADGIEIDLKHKTENDTISGWYAYNHFRSGGNDLSTRATLPALHKCGVSLRRMLDDGWVFNTNFSSSSRVVNNPNFSSGTAFGHKETLDMTLSKKLNNDNAEIMIGCTDILYNDNEAYSTPGKGAVIRTPGRTFFMRLQMKF